MIEGYIFRLMLQFQDLLFRSGVLLPIVREIESELTDVVEFWCCDITKSGLLYVEVGWRSTGKDMMSFDGKHLACRHVLCR